MQSSLLTCLLLHRLWYGDYKLEGLWLMRPEDELCFTCTEFYLIETLVNVFKNGIFYLNFWAFRCTWKKPRRLATLGLGSPWE